MNEIKISSKQIKPLLEKLKIIENLDCCKTAYIKFDIDDNTQLIIDDGVGEALNIKESNYKNTWMRVDPPQVRRNQCWSDMMRLLLKNGILQLDICELLNKQNSIINKYNCHAKTPRPGTILKVYNAYKFKVKDLSQIKLKYPDIIKDENNSR